MQHWPDWESGKERMKAWWAGEDIGRPVVYMTAASGKDAQWPTMPNTGRGRWLDAEFRVAALEATVRANVYLAEGYPYEYPFPMFPSGWIGGKVGFSYDTVWDEPVVEDWDAYEPVFDRGCEMWRESEMWRETVRLVDAMAGAAEGRWIVAMMTIGAPFDIMVALRGPGRLCMDLYDHRERLAVMREKIVAMWPTWYEEIDKVIKAYGQVGSSSWLNLWSPGKMYTLQEDVAGLVGPKDFVEMMLPSVRAMGSWLDNNVFHLDGPSAVVHMKALLATEEVGGIQWVPGAGQRRCAEWPELLRHVSGAGKKMQIEASAEDLMRLVEIVPYQQLAVSLWGMPSREEGEAFLHELEAKCREVRVEGLPGLGEAYEGEEWQTKETRKRSVVPDEMR